MSYILDNLNTRFIIKYIYIKKKKKKILIL